MGSKLNTLQKGKQMQKWRIELLTKDCNGTERNRVSEQNGEDLLEAITNACEQLRYEEVVRFKGELLVGETDWTIKI